jgi:hypothetical protein
MDKVYSEANWNFVDRLSNLHLDLALHRFITFSPDFGNKEHASRRELVQSGFFCNNEQKPQCYYCDLVIHDVGNWKTRIDHQHLQSSINCPLMTDKVHDFPLTSIHNFIYEAWR